MKFFFNKQRLLPPLFFLSISGLLIFSWFRFGYIYGGGDVGLQTYNPSRILEIASYIWWEATGPGSPTPQGLTAIPFNLIFSLLSLLGFNPVMLQASLFFLILLGMGLGMYLLILFLFGKDYRKYAILAGLFYMFNPYMMIQVWHRFVHSTFFFSAAVPFLIIFWMKWIRNRDSLSLLIFLAINLFALYAFGTIAYILTLWLLLFLITIPEIILPWSNLNNTKKVVFLFFIGFLLWLLTNSWWLIPIFTIAPSFLSEQHSNEQTLTTLYTLGYQTVLPYSLQMINPFYLFSQLDFGSSYENVFLRTVPWIFVAIIFIGLIRGIFNPKSAKWSVIYLVILVLSKGVASPLGYFYIFGMKHFFSLGVLRNPFEKMGILLPLVSSILIVVGTKIIYDFFKERINTKFVKISLLLTFLLIFSFCWPMFTGQIFGKFDKPGFVEVPKSYNEADLWIKSDYSKNVNSNPGKILHLPLTTGESITYKWEHGYSGLEPSPLLFTSMPSLSHGFNIKQVDNSLSSLYQVFHKPSLVTPKIILRLLQDFNVRYIVLHKDTKWEGGEFYNPNQTEEVLNNLDFLESSQKFGELVVYKVADRYFRPKISLTSNFDWIYPPESSSLWPWILSEDRILITDLENQKKEGVDSLSTNTLIFPKTSFIYTETSSSATLQLINQLVSNPNLDILWLDPLTRLKKIYKTNNEIQGEEINDKLISASLKILSILRTIFVENKPIPSLLDEYSDEMKDILSSNSAVVSYYARDKAISNIFQVHLYMLRVIANKFQSEKVVKIGDSLKYSLIKNNFISLYYQEGKSSLLEKTVLKFEIPKDLDYELVFTAPSGKDLYQDKIRRVTTIIDGKTDYLVSTKINNVISLGQTYLSAGTHEIVLPALYSDNLVTSTEGNVILENAAFLDKSTIKIDSIEKVSYFENKIDYVSGLDTYQISFSAKVDRGNGFYIQLVQDTDTKESGQVNHQVNQFINQTPEQDWRNYTFPPPTLRATTKNASIRFLTAPAQNSVLIKDLKVFRLFNEDIILRKVGKSGEVSESSVLINQKSPIFYKGKFHLDKPSLLIFSESYHPDWKLTLFKGGQQNTADDQFLANLYSNAWFIKGDGDYDFKLEFEPQKMVNYGIIIALITYGGLVLYGIVSHFSKKK